MTKWIIAVGVVLALVGILLWQLFGDGPSAPTIATRRIDAGGKSLDDADVRPRSAKPSDQPADGGGAASEPELISVHSEEYHHRLDTGFPDKFRARAAGCYTGGGDGDRKLKLGYKLRSQSGMVSATDIRVIESNIGDAALERCLIQAVQDEQFHAEDMPDFEEEGDLFIRLRALKKYKSVEEQIREKQRNR